MQKFICNVRDATRFQERCYNRYMSSEMVEMWHTLTHLPLGKMSSILADDIFKWIFLNENDRIPIQISMKFVPRSSINNKPAFV